MDNKKRLIIICVSLLVVVIIVIWLTIIAKGDKQNKPQNVDIYEYSTPVRSLNKRVYFNVVNIINSYNIAVSNGNGNYLINVMSSDYLNNNSLNSSNIIKFLNPTNMILNYYVTDLVYSCNRNNCYYFAQLEGSMTDSDSINDHKIDKQLFVVVYDKINSTYLIKPVTGASNAKDYALNYTYKDMSIKKNNSNIFINNESDDAVVIKYYLSFVKYVLEFDNDNASNYVKDYSNDKRIDYLNKLSNVLYNYSERVKNGIQMFHGMLYDGSLFTIEEESPMFFKFYFE